MPPSLPTSPLPTVRTRQLQTAIQNAAFIAKEGPVGGNPELKEKGLLKLENVYFSKGKVRVSNSGFRSGWARLWGKPTGVAALRQAILSHNIPPEKVERAMENLALHQDQARPELLQVQIR